MRRGLVWVVVSTFLLGVCVTAPVALIEYAGLGLTFGTYIPHWWPYAFFVDIGLGIGYHLVVYYNMKHDRRGRTRVFPESRHIRPSARSRRLP